MSIFNDKTVRKVMFFSAFFFSNKKLQHSFSVSQKEKKFWPFSQELQFCIFAFGLLSSFFFWFLKWTREFSFWRRVSKGEGKRANYCIPGRFLKPWKVCCRTLHAPLPSRDALKFYILHLRLVSSICFYIKLYFDVNQFDRISWCQDSYLDSYILTSMSTACYPKQTNYKCLFFSFG